MLSDGVSNIYLSVIDTYGASSTEMTTITLAVDMEFQGRVFDGPPGVETTPHPGVSVTLCGSNDQGMVGTEIAAGTTDGNGWYDLHTTQFSYSFYTIVEADPSGFHSVGTHSPDGVEINAHQIRYRTPIGGKDLKGNNFYLQPSNPTEVQTPQSGTFSHQFQLYPNYPNPFNPVTTIPFTIPARQSATLTVYDNLGREVSILFNEVAEPGVHTVTFNTNNLPSGVYFYRLQAGECTQVRKLVLLK
jgi:hypothetical protein